MIVDVIKVDKFKFILESDEISAILNSGFLLLGLRIACFGCGEFMMILCKERDKKFISVSYLCCKCGNIRIVTTYL